MSADNVCMPKRFRVAFSFAGEKRQFVEEVAQILVRQFGQDAILYDKFHEAELARPNLAIYLPKLYAEEADLVVVVVCMDYHAKEWCGLEWRAIYGLLMKRFDHLVMLMRFDRVELEDLYGLPGFIDLEDKTPAQAADSILERLASNEDKPKECYQKQPVASQGLQQSPPSPSDSVLSTGSSAVVRSFPSLAPDPANLALPPLDLTDLFHDRDPIHEEVWSGEIPERIAKVLPALARLPQPLVLGLQTHLSIAWFLGTKLTSKVGISVLLRQRTNAGEQIWDGSIPKVPPEASPWQVSEMELNRGDDLALVVSVTRPALADVERSIPVLALPIRRLLHVQLAEISQSAIADGSHARWLADAVVEKAARVVQDALPPRIHLFLACPVALAFLIGQQAAALGPTTAYEFPFNNPSRLYRPGMAT
jgi:hypothetical protein